MEKAFHSEVGANDDLRRTTSKIISFFRWLPYIIAGCLMILGISQARQILDLKSQLLAARMDVTRLRESNALTGLRLTTLEPKEAANDPSLASSHIVIAWDPYQHEGVVAMENLPTAPTGHDYQLWVLDPAAEAPISAGILTTSHPFMAQSVSTPTPGFAISLEPSGGSSEPVSPILFAVAPGP